MRNQDRYVLVIDDDQDSREVLRELLGDAGYIVRTAPNGAAGLQTLHALLGRTLVVIVDLLMPQVDGFEFVRRARAVAPNAATLPIVVATGDARAAANALMLDVSEVLRKPLARGELLSTVSRLFDDLEEQSTERLGA